MTHLWLKLLRENTTVHIHIRSETKEKPSSVTLHKHLAGVLFDNEYTFNELTEFKC